MQWMQEAPVKPKNYGSCEIIGQYAKSEAALVGGSVKCFGTEASGVKSSALCQLFPV
jgi:hypothetical protein